MAAGGKIIELRARDGRNVVTQANLLAAYHDKPKKWDAWNLDAGYDRRRERIVPAPSAVVDDALEIPFAVGKTSGGDDADLSLRDGEPFLRVELAVDWNAEHRILRLENWLPLADDAVTFGAPHGTVRRSARRETSAQRARVSKKFRQGSGPANVASGRCRAEGVALFALDTPLRLECA